MTDYTSLRLDADKIEPTLAAMGIKELKIVNASESGKMKRITGELDGKEVFATLFFKDKGITIGYSSGKDRDTFDRVAKEIVANCSYAGNHALNLSIRGIGKAVLQQVSEYITENGAVKTHEEDNALALKQRWTGPRGDKLTLTLYKTDTLTIQGINAHLASMIMDMLRVVAPAKTALTMDIDAFEVPVTVTEAINQTEARLPAAHGWIGEEVRKQLSSAQVMSQTALPLEDFAVVSFPALRGLEGFIKQVYVSAGGTMPPEKTPLGDWFEQSGSKWVMRPVNAMHVGKVASIIEEGYTLYHAQRHSLLHMCYDMAASRILPTMDEAKEIVDRVFDYVERSCAKIRS